MPRRVLITDADTDRRATIAAMLMDGFFTVGVAAGAAETLDMLGNESWDIVLIGPSLQEGDPMLLAERIRAVSPLGEVMIVLMVEERLGGAHLVRQVRAIDDILTLPFDEMALHARMRSQIRIKALADDLNLRAEAFGDVPVPSLQDRAPAKGETIRIHGGGAAWSRDHSRTLRDTLSADVIVSGRMPDGDRPLEEEAGLLILHRDPLGPRQALRSIALLRAEPRTRTTAILLVLSPADRSLIAMGLELGADDYMVEPVDGMHLAIRARALLRRQDFARRIRATVHSGLMLARTDPLTNLANLRGLEARYERLRTVPREEGGPIALILVDLDRFKSVNDRHGHAAGDAVLREFARRALRSIRPGDLIARIGGEEFAVILRDADEDLAATVAERLRASVADEGFALADGQSIAITASFGIAITPHARRESLQSLRARADHALYRAKDAGRNRISAGGASAA
ncbi:MAG: diguanylate cyclase [Rubricella sp.]